MVDRNIRFKCDCGTELRTDSEEARLTCDCGRMYIVTITLISPDGTPSSVPPEERL